MGHDTTVADGARLDFAGAMSYGDYLHLDEILGAQHPRSGDPNEMLFIVQHQASELWMKLMLHELLAARDRVRAGDLAPAAKMLSRVAHYYESQLENSIKGFSSMVEPIMMLLVGGIVGTFVLGVFGPIMGIVGALQSKM